MFNSVISKNRKFLFKLCFLSTSLTLLRFFFFSLILSIFLLNLHSPKKINYFGLREYRKQAPYPSDGQSFNLGKIVKTTKNS